MEQNSFTIIDDEGHEVKYDVLFTFQSEETNKDYIVYTDNSKDKEGNVQVYASIYHPKEAQPRLEAIETEQEWKIIDTILKTIQEELKNNQDEQK